MSSVLHTARPPMREAGFFQVRDDSAAYVLFYARVVESAAKEKGHTPIVRRQTISMPDLWPHAPIRVAEPQGPISRS